MAWGTWALILYFGGGCLVGIICATLEHVKQRRCKHDIHWCGRESHHGQCQKCGARFEVWEAPY